MSRGPVEADTNVHAYHDLCKCGHTKIWHKPNGFCTRPGNMTPCRCPEWELKCKSR